MSKKISELTTASALTGSELVEVVQSGTNKKTTTQDIADLGSGSIGGSTGSNDDSIIRADGTGGSTIQSSSVFITDDGRLYGTALHNNAGSVTGTANQYIASGTYTPTITNVTNVSSASAGTCFWIRVGNVVTVSGTLVLDAAAASAFEIGVSLPIASSLASITQVAGTAASETTANIVARIRGDSTNDRASVVFTAPNTNTNDFSFVFNYLII